MSPLRVWYADGPDSPRTSPRDAVAAAGLDDGADLDVMLDVTLGWTIEPHPWLDDTTLSITTVLAGYGLARAVNAGRVTALPVRLSAVPSRILANPPDVAVVTGVRRGDHCAFSTAVGWGDVLARTAERVVVEIGLTAPDLGGPLVEGQIVATLERPMPVGPMPTAPAASRVADSIDLSIGATVAALLPEEPTLQFGPGGIAEGIARSIDQPVRIWSGLVTDAVAELHDRGLLIEPAVAAYTWGGEPIERLAEAGMLRLSSSTVTHDLSAISAIPRFVGCNTALQVGLDGAVNLERVGDRIVAAVGGHADFSAGASRSVGGMSIVALRSTTRTGESTIVPRVDVVSTARSDVDVVVTEHGIADLRGVSDTERARRLIAVADPVHRDGLSRL
ncbi:MAG TPA: acetyl-CoA hydrolase/transferase C-terminal domain-containing protein [Ilumatobacter sp.]|nr:acetyl-CoA hydrolase/transferase C-terminal domain-containing protein [Ilumatobacter sp.]